MLSSDGHFKHCIGREVLICQDLVAIVLRVAIVIVDSAAILEPRSGVENSTDQVRRRGSEPSAVTSNR
jgi:hypothetical protein